MKTLAAVLSFALLAATVAASAEANTPLKPPRVYTGIYQPKSTPAKASSFAPRPGNRRRVYGAPIQSPIFNRAVSKTAKPGAAQGLKRP